MAHAISAATPVTRRCHARGAGLLLALLALAAAGCGPRNFANTNDRLRAENLELTRRVEQLEEALRLRVGQIASLRSQLEVGDPAAIPGVEPIRLSGVTLDSYSGPVDTDGDGVHDLIRLYFTPRDQHGRMMPVAGRAHVQAVRIRRGADPRVVAQRTLGPAELDAAYRTGFTGSHYTAELPLPADAEPGELTVKLTLTDARSGADFTAQAVYPIRR